DRMQAPFRPLRMCFRAWRAAVMGERSDERPDTGTLPRFGDLLQQLRIAAGLTQDALAEHAQMSERAIRKLERGESRSPRADTLQLLLRALAPTPEQRELLRVAARARRPHRASGSVAGAPDDRAGRVPVPPTPLIGRHKEMRAARALLTDADGRLL